jgi:hypothetical protein
VRGSFAKHLHDQTSDYSRQDAQKQAAIEMKNGIVYGNWNNSVHVPRLKYDHRRILNRIDGTEFLKALITEDIQ